MAATSAPPNYNKPLHEEADVNQELTDRQAKILDYIRDVTRVRNYPPSVREIGEAVGLASSAAVHNHLNPVEGGRGVRGDPLKVRAGLAGAAHTKHEKGQAA